MRDTKGFTLVEAMIGMVILGVVIAGALSFFMLWSSRSTETFRYKDADETVATAVSLITSDIRKAGFGNTSNPEYAVFVVDNGTTQDELYLNCGEYLNFEGDIRAPTAYPEWVAYRCINSVFKPNRQFTLSGVNLAYQARVTLDTVSDFTLWGIPKVYGASNYSNIGAVIAASGTPPTAFAADVNIKGTSATDGTITGTQDWTFPLVSSSGKYSDGSSAALSVGLVVAPAISYKVILTPDGGITGGALWRNRGSSAAPFGTPILGGTPYLDVTGLSVSCQFINGTEISMADTNTTPALLRAVQVTLQYRVMISKTQTTDTGGKIRGWGPTVRRQILVSPRSLAISAQM
jgi:prepilin-type N-terminal cleavage/methylation domain-containing protein